MAGLNRLSIERDDIRPLSFEESIPAAGQGALGIQCLTVRADVREILQSIHDPNTEAEILVERAFLEKFGGGCHVAAGCIAEFNTGWISARAFAEVDGQVKTVSGQGDNSVALGESLAEQCLAQ
jgi:hydroxymethylbilane synthase